MTGAVIQQHLSDRRIFMVQLFQEYQGNTQLDF